MGFLARGYSRRRGAALLMVLIIISMAMGVFYGVLRTQGTQTQLSANGNYASGARQAALAGIAIALRKINEPGWGGVNTVLADSVSPEQAYQVSFTTGDPALTVASPDYADYPFRVTLVSTGYSPADPAVLNRSEFKVRAVVQLVPRKINSAGQPTHWSTMNQYTLYQFEYRDSYMDLPARIEGPAHLEGHLYLAPYLPPEATPSTSNKPFDGLIDEVAIFNTALTQTQIQSVYTQATGSQTLPTAYAAVSPTYWWRFQEPYNALVATATAGSSGVYHGAKSGHRGASIASDNYAARFDGVDDFINVGNLDVSGSALTILAWFKADDFDWTDGRILSKATDSASTSQYWMLSTVSSSGEKLRFRLRTGGSVTTLVATSGTISAGEWVFAAAVYDGSQMKLYKNGTLVGSTSKTGTIDENTSVPVYIGNNPPQPSESPRSRYLRDLKAMQLAGGADYRPLTGPVELCPGCNAGLIYANLQDDLLLSLTDNTASSAGPTRPTGITTYRLYPGGQEYAIPSLPSQLSNISYAPNPVTNPLGVYRRAGTIDVRNNVSIQGTVMTDASDGDLLLRGVNIHITPVALRLPSGTSGTWQLPSTMVADDLWVDGDAEAEIKGLTTVWDNFELSYGANAATVDVKGRLFVRDLLLYGQDPWANYGESWWTTQLSTFYSQLLAGTSGTPYFPQWIQTTYGLSPEPKVKVSPDAQVDGSHPQYIWPDWSQPIYLPHPDDADPGQNPGLRWDLVRWEEGV